jgi:hypothetical protein
MNCGQFEERIAQYMDGDLYRDEVPEVEAHLRSCPGCAEFAERLEGDRISLRTPAPECFEVDFAALRRQIRRGIVRERRQRRLVPVLLIAASILLAVGGGAIWFGAGRVGPQPSGTAQVQVGPALPLEGAKNSRPGDARGEDTRQASTRVSTRQARVLAPPGTPILRADPALEAALLEFSASEETAEASSVAASAVEIRIVTGDPNVILILLQETSGGPNE